MADSGQRRAVDTGQDIARALGILYTSEREEISHVAFRRIHSDVNSRCFRMDAPTPSSGSDQIDPDSPNGPAPLLNSYFPNPIR